MNKLSQAKQFLPLLLLGVIVFSCSKTEDENLETIKTNLPVEQSKNFVSIDQASGIASALEYLTKENSSLRKLRKTSKLKNVKSVTEVPDNNGSTSYYIINYKDGGFVIISADNRVSPILAFSESGKFSLDFEKQYPGGLVDWLIDTKDFIKKVRDSNSEQTKRVAHAWQPSEIRYTINPNIERGFDTDSCIEVKAVVKPLLKTTWGEGSGYNDLVPKTDCDNFTGNNRAPAGSVATAMAQIMKYYQFPNTYNWDSMPNDQGSSETSRLIRDIGSKVGMKYKCDRSSVHSVKKEVRSAFINDFGYLSASYKPIYKNDESIKSLIIEQLKLKKPVMLKGNIRETNFWGHSVFVSGHTWVCDGYTICNSSSNDEEQLFFHANWGRNKDLNGWYSYQNSWKPTGKYEFSSKRGIVYDITPPLP